MPAAPTSIVALTGVLNIVSAKAADATTQNADNFLSLLNAGGGSHSSVDSGQSQSSKDDSRDHTQDPQAVAIDAPAQRLSPQKETPKPDDNTSAPVDNNTRGSNDNVKPAAADKSSPATDNTTQDKPLGKVLSSDQADSTTAATDTASTTSTSDQQAIDDIIAQEAGLRDQLQKQLGKISDLLLAFIQALTGGSQTQTASADTTSQTSQQGVSGTSATDPTASELALLKEIQSLVQQLQLALQPSGNQSQADNSAQIQLLIQARLQAQGDNSQQDQLQALLDKMSQDIIQLAALFQQTDSNGNKIDPFATANVPQVGDLKALLKASIGEVKGQLQKLRGLNEAIFTQAKQNLQATLSQSDPSKDSGAGNDLFASNAPVTTIAQQAATASAASPLQLPTVQTTDTMPLIVQAAQTGVSQNGADNSGNSSGQNNQSQPQPLAAVSSASGTQAGAAANATFARVMTQVNQGSLLEQVVFHVRTAVADGSSRIHIQLEPASLGKLDIKLDVDADGKTGVMISADNKSTLDLLQHDMQGLQRALADAGLTTDSGSMNFNLNQQQDNGQNTQAAQNYQSAQPADETDVEINPITRSYVVNLAEGLDIKI